MKLWMPIVVCGIAVAQETPHQHPMTPPQVPLQPLAQHVRQLEEAMTYLGQPFKSADLRRIDEAIANPDEAAAVHALESILDPYVLMIVDINPESRVKVEEGTATPELVEAGTRLFLVKLLNNGHVRAPLVVQSPNSGDVYVPSNGNPAPAIQLSPQESKERWASISLYQRAPMRARLSGLALEYAILEVYSRDAGQRSAKISFNVGQGSQDIGFRNDVTVLFNAVPARRITLHVKDDKGRPTMASFIIKDRLDRIYPMPSKRLAPDFFFQPQIYRADGESIQLPDGYYTFEYTGGPEYLTHTRELPADSNELSFQLDRWIDPSAFGWFSGDHHVHAAGCSHYMNPTEGVQPADMMRQILGEHLNIGSVLTWGPDYYYQKQFFSAKDHPLSRPEQLMHYDLEVSGFPSSHAGHIVLLNLKQQDYPGTKHIDDWPTWDLPIFRWAKSQGAIVGFAHSGWGLEVAGKELPTYQMPGFDGIGANEYIVDVTYPNTVDFISSVDTPYVWELNIWYHTLNVGFRTSIAGETDFPCIYDGKVGLGRTYAKLDHTLTYEGWLRSLQAGRSYVSDGKTHLMDLNVNGTPAGAGVTPGEVRLTAPGTVTATVTAAAYLPVKPNEAIRRLPYDQKPYWDVERARIGDTREVAVEIVVNGKAVSSQTIVADGKLHELKFAVPVKESSWIAARVLPSAHTNPVFAIVGGKPIRASRASAEWCLNAVNQCWTQKAPRIRPSELTEAKQAYDHAREVYRRLISESSGN
ncbi:MAG TPA: CehA/McbA family metallohydrolase [Bryobacteraceae bacterium]|nr:CehA/McbA family metallohydrolase [Bryobacteraceae bacterium]